jgi:cell division protein FtsI/penicillin-binding protein 2
VSHTVAQIGRWIVGLMVGLCPLIGCAQTVDELMTRALQATHGSGVIVDWDSGTVLASVGGRASASPGSVLKPLLLHYGLEHGIIRSDTRVFCRRNVIIDGQVLRCTHPADRPLLDAQSALAESCNTWFAALGQRFSGPQLQAALRATRLPHAAMLSASVEQRQLAVLGLRGVTATPATLVFAYRDLLTKMSTSDPVWLGLLDAVNYGMSNPARIAGVTVLGKTGTAGDPREAWTHGWFAGAVPGRFVVVVYIPHGDGADAARIAAGVMQSVLSRSDHR